jgi:hypothetical protein
MIAKADDEWFDELGDWNPDALLADGFEDAIIGFTVNQHHPIVVVYDYDQCVKKLMDDGLSEDDASEYLTFNTLGAYVGENGPLFVRKK